MLYIKQFGGLAALLQNLTPFYQIPGNTKDETLEKIRFFKDVIDKDYPDYVTDYSFWNNTDKPDDVTQASWRRREYTWEEICLYDGGWDVTRLYHAIIEPKSYNDQSKFQARIIENRKII